MTPIADMVAQMLAAGIDHAVIVLAVRTAEQAASTSSRVDSRVDAAMERRREWDRNYRRAKRGSQVDSTRHPPDIHPTHEKPPLLTSSQHTQDPEKGKKVRGLRKQLADIPPDWRPPDRAYEIANHLGVRIQDVEPRFRDYLASSGKKYADYDAGFCNFVRNTPKFNGATRNGHGTRTLASAADDLIARAEEREQQERDSAFDFTPRGG